MSRAYLPDATEPVAPSAILGRDAWEQRGGRMPQAKETILRQWCLLQEIPRHPSAVGTRELSRRLRDRGYGVDVRTIQRDLLRLSAIFPLVSQEHGKAYRWSWMEQARVMDIPGMDPATALAFRLAEDYLAPLLPAATLSHLGSHFRRAKEVLAMTQGNGLALWPDKVCVITRWPHLSPPYIEPEVQDAVTRALLDGRQVQITYWPKGATSPKSYSVNPLGLVFRDGIAYRVGTAKDYEGIRHFALHRIRSALLTESPCRLQPGFDLHAYVKRDQFFAYPLT